MSLKPLLFTSLSEKELQKNIVKEFIFYPFSVNAMNTNVFFLKTVCRISIVDISLKCCVQNYFETNATKYFRSNELIS